MPKELTDGDRLCVELGILTIQQERMLVEIRNDITGLSMLWHNLFRLPSGLSTSEKLRGPDGSRPNM